LVLTWNKIDIHGNSRTISIKVVAPFIYFMRHQVVAVVAELLLLHKIRPLSIGNHFMCLSYLVTGAHIEVPKVARSHFSLKAKIFAFIVFKVQISFIFYFVHRYFVLLYHFWYLLIFAICLHLKSVQVSQWLLGIYRCLLLLNWKLSTTIVVCCVQCWLVFRIVRYLGFLKFLTINLAKSLRSLSFQTILPLVGVNWDQRLCILGAF
jgi:hypothetical protein